MAEGLRELFITQAGRGEYLCKVISSIHQFAGADESRLDLVEGGRELIIRRAEPVDKGEYTCTANLKYPPNVQVYNESRLDLCGYLYIIIHTENSYMYLA